MRINEIKLDKDKVYILCQCQGGDLFIFCGFVQELIKKYNAEVIFMKQLWNCVIIKII